MPRTKLIEEPRYAGGMCIVLKSQKLMLFSFCLYWTQAVFDPDGLNQSLHLHLCVVESQRSKIMVCVSSLAKIRVLYAYT